MVYEIDSVAREFAVPIVPFQRSCHDRAPNTAVSDYLRELIKNNATTKIKNRSPDLILSYHDL